VLPAAAVLWPWLLVAVLLLLKKAGHCRHHSHPHPEHGCCGARPLCSQPASQQATSALAKAAGCCKPSCSLITQAPCCCEALLPQIMLLTVLYCTVLYCTVLYCTAKYCAALCFSNGSTTPASASQHNIKHFASFGPDMLHNWISSNVA
jgi:hypothetical protein